MKRQSREALDAYYQEADSWAKDRITNETRARRVAWIVAGCAATIAVCEAIALATLLPLKSVVPYTLLVDKQTGHVQALKPTDSATIAPDAALTQSFLVQYVVARESFDIDALQVNYRKTALWSADRARTDYIAGMQASNAESPLVRNPRSTVVETRIKSVSPLDGDAALVRFDTVRRDASGQVQPSRPWTAVIRYRFSDKPLAIEDRFINPLGFQVLRYNRNPEALPPAPELSATPPARREITVVRVAPASRNPDIQGAKP